MRVAVIGSGIAGNTVAYYLSKSHDITLYEANNYLGGHTHTHDVEWQGRAYSIDTGFIVFNQRTYPNFIKLLNELKVSFEPTQMSFSVKDSLADFEYSGRSLNTLFAQRKNIVNLAFYKMIADILRFNKEALIEVIKTKADITLGEFLADKRYSKQFINNYILPMGAAIWSTDIEAMYAFPAQFFIRFLHNHGLLTVTNQPQWLVIKGGSREYLKPLTHNFSESIRLSSPVEQIHRNEKSVEIRTLANGTETFDAVFVATHSDQALAMLDAPSAEETAILGAIKYQQNEAVLHTDETVLPKRKRAWAAWNYNLRAPSASGVAVTYNMNILQNLSAPVQFCVTLNDSESIDPAKVIRKIAYSHPIYTPQSVAAQSRYEQINGQNRTYYCGAYWRNGFHEDGVVSAQNAVAKFTKHYE